jgi:hypothetical protein
LTRKNELGLSREDVARIQALAESLDPLDGSTPPLVDLSVPIRVVAVRRGEESRFSGEVLGEWAGRSILFWRMTNREREAWAAGR